MSGGKTVPGGPPVGPPPAAAEVAGRALRLSRLEVPPWPPGRPGLVSCRLSGGDLVVDLPVQVPVGGWARVATVRADTRADGGWSRRAWRPGPVGFGLPAGTALGDLVAVAVEQASVYPASSDEPSLSASPDGPDAGVLVVAATWCGYVHAVEPGAVVLRGPFEGVLAAHGAAQQALVSQRHQPPSPDPGPARRLAGRARPPASVTVTIGGPSATVGDPAHGWMTVPTVRLLAAMAIPADQLRTLLRPSLGPLPAGTAQVTLAALTAIRAPDRLPDIHRPPGTQPAATGWVPDTSFADPPDRAALQPAWPAAAGGGWVPDLPEPGPDLGGVLP